MRVAVCGIGNRIRGDDGVGPEVITELRSQVSEECMLYDFDENPENFIGDLIDYGPEKVILVDAVDMGQKPGSVGLIDFHSVKKQVMSTHKMPVSMFIEHLQNRMRFKLIFVGVQPKDIGLNKEMSNEVRQAIPLAAELVKKNMETD
jgi:hydrogenase 3 maturation protease